MRKKSENRPKIPKDNAEGEEKKKEKKKGRSFWGKSEKLDSDGGEILSSSSSDDEATIADSKKASSSSLDEKSERPDIANAKSNDGISDMSFERPKLNLDDEKMKEIQRLISANFE